MSETIALQKAAMDMLLATSRTFFIPISRLSGELQEAVSGAYLCMRAIDEIEDHEELPSEVKKNLLCSVGRILKHDFSEADLNSLYQPYQSLLPEVTLQLGNWMKLCPAPVAKDVWNATAIMAEGMAKWVSKEWKIKTEEDLDDYTYYVAGLVGVMLSDIWMWHGRIETDREQAVAFGRGLQAVNIIRNRAEDLDRGVDFFPDGWGFEEMFEYARRNLALADAYTEKIPPGPILDFCKIPLVLAHGTLAALEAGEAKLSRSAVTELVRQVAGE